MPLPAVAEKVEVRVASLVAEVACIEAGETPEVAVSSTVIETEAPSVQLVASHEPAQST